MLKWKLKHFNLAIAVPNDAVQTSVDQCLRMVCCAILEGDTSIHDSKMKSIATAIASEGGKEYAGAVIPTSTP